MTVPAEPYKDPWFLRVAYHGRGQSMEQIGQVCGVDGRTVWHWMKKHGIDRRPGCAGTVPKHGYRVS